MSTSLRPLRARKDRPCDQCRRHKHLCVIPVRGEPCDGCKARHKECTFDDPPVKRKRKTSMAPSVDPHAPAAVNGLPRALGESDARFNTNHQALGTSLSPTAPMATHHDPLPWPEVSSFDPTSTTVARAPRPLRQESLEETNQESHFLGTGRLPHFSVGGLFPQASSSTSESTFPRISQVSTDPMEPVFFIKSPGLLYGRSPVSSQQAFENARSIASAAAGPDALSRAISSFQRKTLPAIPILNANRLESECLGLESGAPVSHGVLTGIIAHSTHYNPSLRPSHTELWQQALIALDEDYRSPRLSTIQLALMPMYSRPLERGENSGQLAISLARALGAANLLGLHLDPTGWVLPAWEISLRRRLWWALFNQDKWRGLMYGMPSNIQAGRNQVKLPALEDADLRSPSDIISFQAFLATCNLSVIIEELLGALESISKTSNEGLISRCSIVESLIGKVVGNNVPDPLQWRPDRPSFLTAPTGVRSYQLSHLGLLVMLQWILVENIPPNSPVALESAFSAALHRCENVIKFVSSLSNGDREVYWGYSSSHHISNAVGLLARIYLQGSSTQSASAVVASAMITPFVRHLVRLHNETAWDIVSVALRRMTGMLRAIPEGDPALGGIRKDLLDMYEPPQTDLHFTVEDFFASLGVNLDFDPLISESDWIQGTPQL